ncbi:MAG: hypothetical protein JWR80_6293 [Bradyrhizobium sp.]|nr:hypothetical protein [Bradyrhizobium sp.]
MDHRFEGWFASAEEFEAQRDRGLLSCPLCGSPEVSKQLSAPRLNLHAQQPADEKKLPARKSGGASMPVPANTGAPQQMAVLSQHQQDALRVLIAEVLSNTEDVGSRFAEEARRIHYKEAEERAIRGVASREEAQALIEEGIEVAQLPVGVVDKSRLN